MVQALGFPEGVDHTESAAGKLRKAKDAPHSDATEEEPSDTWTFLPDAHGVLCAAH